MRCNDRSLAMRREVNRQLLEEFVRSERREANRDRVTDAMCECVGYMRGRPLHHICQELVANGFRGADITKRLAEVERRLH